MTTTTAIAATAATAITIVVPGRRPAITLLAPSALIVLDFGVVRTFRSAVGRPEALHYIGVENAVTGGRRPGETARPGAASSAVPSRCF